jgi:ADP-ribose pyrophosphatase YjhB (NUDIX family)
MSRIANFCPRCGHALELQVAYERQHPVCPKCDFIVFFDPKVAVLAFIVQNGKVLLVKRAINPGQGQWACPAGFVEYDEAPEDAVIREVQEETGLITVVSNLLEVFPKKDEGLADIVIAYRMQITGGKLAAADDAEEVAWFGRDNLPELVFYPSLTLVGGKWRNGKL